MKMLLKMEESGLVVTPTSVKNVRKLYTRAARMALVQRVMAEGVKRQSDWERLVSDAQFEMLVEFHWREGPWLTREKALDEEAKANWASTLTVEALGFNPGTWKPSDEQPYPEWTMLEQARLYNEAKYAAVLEQMQRPPLRPVLISDEHGEVRGLQQGDHPVRMFAHGATVPDGVRQLRFKLVLHHAQTLSRLTPFACAALSAGAMVAVWGTAHDVRLTCDTLHELGTNLRSVTVYYFVRGLAGHAGTGDFLAAERAIRIVGRAECFREQVWLLPLSLGYHPPPGGSTKFSIPLSGTSSGRLLSQIPSA